MSSFFSARKHSDDGAASSPLSRVQDLQSSYFKRLSAPAPSLASPAGKLDWGVP